MSLLISLPLSGQNQLKENSSIQKKAQEFFNSKDYENALINYNLLLKTYPKDPELNYYSGICLTELEQNLNNAIYKLKLASLSPVPANVYFYLGKANYQMNHFDEALTYFERFKKTGSREDQKNLKADQWIAWAESRISDSSPVIQYYGPPASRIPKEVPGRSSNIYIEQVSDAFYEQAQIKKIISLEDVRALSEMDNLNKAYNTSMQQSWELDKEQEKQKVVVSAAGSHAESNRALRKINSLEKQSSQKKLQAFKGYHNINSGKYVIYKSNIDRILEDKNNKNYKEIKSYALNSEENYKNSVKLKEEAEMVTDWEEEFDLYGESNAYELMALENQKKAIAVYAGIINPERIDESPDQALIHPQKKEPLQIAKDYPGPIPTPIKEEEKEPTPDVVIVKFPTQKESLIVEEKSIPELTREIATPVIVSETSTQEINNFSILPTPDYNKMIPIPLDQILPDGIVYKIQLGVFKNLRTQSYFRGLQPITAESIKDKDLIRYFAGLFSDYENARSALRKVRKNEFKDAFIVAYYNGQKISTDRAKLYKKEGKDNIPENTELEQHNVYFEIQIGVFSKEVGPDLYRTFENHAEENKLESFVNKNGNVVYTIGKFLTFDSARSFNKELKTKGLSDAFVIAFDKSKRISIREAQILLNEK
ncbi:MAG: hypothetical protein U9N53_05500 [Bacteroidota bacterium]|nr:hypothetical protein [Bacteroidota bacterium]